VTRERQGRGERNRDEGGTREEGVTVGSLGHGIPRSASSRRVREERGRDEGGTREGRGRDEGGTGRKE
jgi:hypothetical protein